MSGLDLGRLGKGSDGWRCKVERNFMRGTVKVWLVRPRGREWEFITSDLNTVKHLNDGELLPDFPSMEIPEGCLEALMAAAGDVLPPSAATDRHLADTIKVRDRLFDIIEKRVDLT